MPTKRCSRCQQFKDTSAFSKNKNNKDGFHYWCKLCMHIHQQNTRVALTTKQKIWRDQHPLLLKKYRKNWNEIHRDQNYASIYRWQRQNPELFKQMRIKHYTKRHRHLDWVPLFPNPFNGNEPICWHHINNKYVVAIPKDIHALYSSRDTEIHRINIGYVIKQLYPEEVIKFLK